MIKNHIAAAMACLFLGASVLLFLWRLDFYAWSRAADATVVKVASTNGYCGRGRVGSCVRAKAILAYEVRGHAYETTAAAGTHTITGRKSLSHLSQGQHTTVRYDSRAPWSACHDSFFEMWEAPILGLFITMGAAFGAVVRAPEGRILVTPTRSFWR